MKLEGSQEPVQLPEKEANALTKELRHHRELVGLGLSVYAYISKQGVRALHVAVDRSTFAGNYDSYNLYYRADTELTKLVKNAVKRIRAHYSL